MMYRLEAATVFHKDAIRTLRKEMKPYVIELWGAWNESREDEKFGPNWQPDDYNMILVDDQIAGFVQIEIGDDEDFLANIIIAESSQPRPWKSNTQSTQAGIRKILKAHSS